MTDLFGNAAGRQEAEASAGGRRPLADRLRPARLSEVVGQEAILGPEGPLGAMLAAGELSSAILWGPPGVGKTTIARLLAEETDLAFVQVSAIFTGVAELRTVFDAAKQRHASGGGTLLFVDEIHRFNRAQQDGFLPHMESGAIVLVGATTENPSFELNAALLSRAQVLRLEALDEAALAILLDRAEGEAGPLGLDDAARATLIAMADGDGRALVSLVEQVALLGPGPHSEAELRTRLVRRAPRYDKSRDSHYGLISALHKAVRGSDADAALYWFARMVDGGEDPSFLARRILRMAYEDIGLADPDAPHRCLAAWETYDRLGSPEGELALAEAVVYLAMAPKSNAAYLAYGAAQRLAKETGSAPPPDHILNAPTRMMKRMGFGAGYSYDHDAPDGFSGQSYMPDGIGRPTLYSPVERGYEREMQKRLAYFSRLRAKRTES